MRVLPVLAKSVFAGFLIALVTGLVAAFGTRLGFWDLHFGLDVLLPWCVGIATLTFAAGLIWMLWAMIANDGSASRYGLIGFFGAIVVLYNPVTEYMSGLGMPPLHDVSTDTEHAPPFVALLTQRPEATNSPDYNGSERIFFNGKWSTASLLQHKYEGGVRAASVLVSPEKLFHRVLNTVYSMGWTVVSIDPDQGRIEATDTSFFFGETDDIVLRVKPAGMGARVDLRSASRIGKDDHGRNSRRVVAFLKKLATEN